MVSIHGKYSVRWGLRLVVIKGTSDADRTRRWRRGPTDYVRWRRIAPGGYWPPRFHCDADTNFYTLLLCNFSHPGHPPPTLYCNIFLATSFLRYHPLWHHPPHPSVISFLSLRDITPRDIIFLALLPPVMSFPSLLWCHSGWSLLPARHFLRHELDTLLYILLYLLSFLIKVV